MGGGGHLNSAASPPPNEWRSGLGGQRPPPQRVAFGAWGYMVCRERRDLGSAKPKAAPAEGGGVVRRGRRAVAAVTVWGCAEWRRCAEGEGGSVARAAVVVRAVSERSASGGGET